MQTRYFYNATSQGASAPGYHETASLGVLALVAMYWCNG